MEVSKRKNSDQKQVIESLQKLAEDYLSGWQRCKADFENYKKQQSEWANNFRLQANEDIIQEIIPVIDNFELAIKHIPQTPENKSWLEGIAHIEKQLGEVLSGQNVKKIDTQPGDLFNPNIHECIMEKERQARPDDLLVGRDSKNQKNNLIVEAVVRNGYLLGEKILRPAKVTITTKNEKND